MNILGLENNRFQKKAREKQNKRHVESQSNGSSKNGSSNYISLKTAFYSADQNTSYTSIAFEQEEFELKIPLSMTKSFIQKLDEQSRRKNFE